MGETLPEVIIGVIVVSSLSAAIHVAAAYRATRPDIRELIDASAKPRGRSDPG
jgi:hypothetical protein